MANQNNDLVGVDGDTNTPFSVPMPPSYPSDTSEDAGSSLPAGSSSATENLSQVPPSGDDDTSSVSQTPYPSLTWAEQSNQALDPLELIQYQQQFQHHMIMLQQQMQLQQQLHQQYQEQQQHHHQQQQQLHQQYIEQHQQLQEQYLEQQGEEEEGEHEQDHEQEHDLEHQSEQPVIDTTADLSELTHTQTPTESILSDSDFPITIHGILEGLNMFSESLPGATTPPLPPLPQQYTPLPGHVFSHALVVPAPAGPPPQVTITAVTNNNLAPTNDNFKTFLKRWACYTFSSRMLWPEEKPYEISEPLGPVLSEPAIQRQVNAKLTLIRHDDLNGDKYDMQGINWLDLGVTRRQARAYRNKMYRNYTSLANSDRWKPAYHEIMPPSTETYFRFRRTHLRKNVHVAHFQLRNLLATASRSRAYYVDRRGLVCHFNTLTGKASTALRFSQYSDVQISTIAAGQGVLVAGGFGGEYCVSNIDSEYIDENPGETRFEGKVTLDQASGISNHIQVHSLRSSTGPLAAFASNDNALRVLDINTQRIMSDVRFEFALNCSAVSPDMRLRVVLGDDKDVFIIPAAPDRSKAGPDGVQKPDTLQRLTGHNDYGFACAWADDAYTLATGSQDRSIKIWDARKWCNSDGKSMPVATLRTELAGARSLHFSPAGSGKRVLVAAEESDIISIIDAQTFASRQSFDVFGEIAGVSLTGNGQDMLALCSDATRGGILQFERYGMEKIAATFDEGYDPNRRELHWRGATSFDWPYGGMPSAAQRRRQRAATRRLRAAASSQLPAIEHETTE